MDTYQQLYRQAEEQRRVLLKALMDITHRPLEEVRKIAGDAVDYMLDIAFQPLPQTVEKTEKVDEAA